MNRTIALFVALAVMFAHTLAIHDTAADVFGPPYELAHACYRVSRNLVYEGQLAWNPGGAGFDAYPSPLWLAITAFAQRAYLGVNDFSQTVGILSVLACVVAMAGFRRERAAGLIAPLCMIVNGGMAGAAASGTENALFILLVTLSFLSFERGWPKRMAVFLTLLVLARPEGAVLTLGLAGLTLIRTDLEALSSQPPLRRLRPFLPAFLAVLAVWVMRLVLKGYWLSPLSMEMLDVSGAKLVSGMKFLGIFAKSQVTPLLIVIPLIYLTRGKLSGSGRRGLALAGLWFIVILLQGGVSLPLAQAAMPALPFLFVAIQGGMMRALDAQDVVRKSALFCLGGALLASGLASRTPSNLGPLPLKDVYTTWLGTGVPSRFGYDGKMGRAGLAEEMRNTRQLRTFGLFFRDNLEESHTVLTPWPGAIAYLSQLEVIDLLGRTHLWPGQVHLNPWLGEHRVDTLQAIESEPSYIVFSIGPAQQAPSPRDIARLWIQELDSRPDAPGRAASIARALGDYEATAIPIPSAFPTRSGRKWSHHYVLRRRELELSPKLDLTLEGGHYVIEARHTSYNQLCELRVTLVDDTGKHWSVKPTGEVEPRLVAVARTGLMLYAADRPFLLMEGDLPPLPKEANGARAVELRAALVNPGTLGMHEFALVSEEVAVPLE